MTDCCTTSSCDRTTPKNAVCPRNGRAYPMVARRTVLHHMRTPWQRSLSSQAYYFCDDPACDVVYFGADQSLLTRTDVRTEVGQKSCAPGKTLCYCFDISATDIQNDDEYVRARAFVIEQTRNETCDCTVRNPSGRCCLKDLPQKL